MYFHTLTFFSGPSWPTLFQRPFKTHTFSVAYQGPHFFSGLSRPTLFSGLSRPTLFSGLSSPTLFQWPCQRCTYFFIQRRTLPNSNVLLCIIIGMITSWFYIVIIMVLSYLLKFICLIMFGYFLTLSWPCLDLNFVLILTDSNFSVFLFFHIEERF